MKAKRILLSLCATVMLSLSIFSFSLAGVNDIEPEPTRSNGGIVTFSIDPDPLR